MLNNEYGWWCYFSLFTFLPVDILEESLSDITKLILRFWKKAAAAAGRYIWSDYIHEKDYWFKEKVDLHFHAASLLSYKQCSSLKNWAWRSTWKYPEIYENWYSTVLHKNTILIFSNHMLIAQAPITFQQTFLCLYFHGYNLTKCIVSQHRISPLDPMIYVYFFSKQTLLLTSTYNVNLGKGFLWPLSSAASKKEVIVWLLFSYIVGEVCIL